MQRRTFLRSVGLASGGAVALPYALLANAGQPIRRVLVIFKCHLDVGFTQTQALVMRRYFDVYFPAAMATAEQLRNVGGDRYTWTTGSWLLYEYLEQASTVQRHAVEEAVSAGDLAWHALPFSWQTEMLDRSMIDGALGFSAALDARFGRKTTGAKMSDVPGHTRGIIAPLTSAGITLLDIGVNAASTPPEVPEVFLWKDAAGRTLVMLYHRHDYGGVISIPGSDLAVAVEVRNDNNGPHTIDEIAAIYARLRAQFPDASVRPADLSQVALAVEPFRAHLPVVTQEIGDTWIYGVASDPPKVARYRDLARLRQAWLTQGKFSVGDATDRQLLRRLLLEVEHTWGTDTKSYLDNAHYRPRDLAAMLAQPGYVTMETSWREKREDLNLSIANLPEPLQSEAKKRLTSQTKPFSAEGLTEYPAEKVLNTKHFSVMIDPQSGAIIHLKSRTSGRDWASPQHPLALFTYQTLSTADFAEYLNNYVKSKEDWAPRDFGKPGIEAFGAQSREWHPVLVRSRMARNLQETQLLLDLRIDDPAAVAVENVAWPSAIELEVKLPSAKPVVEVRLRTLGKPANRLPEAMWLTFAPALAAGYRLSFNKSDQTVNSRDVVRGGSRAMHAVSDMVQFVEPGSSYDFELTTWDAPLIALGQRSPLNYNAEQPSLESGVHVCLYNNAWGTNYPQWCGGDWDYRFTLRG